MAKRITLEVEYEIGDTVYLLTDPEQNRCLVYMIEVGPSRSISYRVTRGTTISSHYSFELSATPDIIYRTNN